MSNYLAFAQKLRQPIGGARLLDLVRLATLAANGHNSQPWRFRLAENTVRIEPDFDRRTPAVDPDDHHLFASLGCAAENLVVAASAVGLHGTPRFIPMGIGALQIDLESGPVVASDLAAAILLRQTTRAEFDGSLLSAAMIATLSEAAQEPGVAVAVLTDRAMLDKLRDLVVEGNTRQLQDARFLRELKHWMRFNPRAAQATGDGIFSGASGNPSLPDWVGGIAFDLVMKPETDGDKYARQIRSSAGAIVFSGEWSDPDHWAKVGRACQRFALKATAMGLKHAFINQPVEVSDLRAELANLAGLPGRRPDIVMRIGLGPELPRSLRRPVPDVIVATS